MVDDPKFMIIKNVKTFDLTGKETGNLISEGYRVEYEILVTNISTVEAKDILVSDDLTVLKNTNGELIYKNFSAILNETAVNPYDGKTVVIPKIEANKSARLVLTAYVKTGLTFVDGELIENIAVVGEDVSCNIETEDCAPVTPEKPKILIEKYVLNTKSFGDVSKGDIGKIKPSINDEVIYETIVTNTTSTTILSGNLRVTDDIIEIIGKSSKKIYENIKILSVKINNQDVAYRSDEELKEIIIDHEVRPQQKVIIKVKGVVRNDANLIKREIIQSISSAKIIIASQKSTRAKEVSQEEVVSCVLTELENCAPVTPYMVDYNNFTVAKEVEAIGGSLDGKVTSSSEVLYSITITNKNQEELETPSVLVDKILDIYVDSNKTETLYKDYKVQSIKILDINKNSLGEIDLGTGVGIYQSGKITISNLNDLMDGLTIENFPGLIILKFNILAIVKDNLKFDPNYPIPNVAIFKPQLDIDKPSCSIDQDYNPIDNSQCAPVYGENKGELIIKKRTEKLEVSVGKFVPYTIEIMNNSLETVNDFYIVDKIPAGFIYVKDSAILKVGNDEFKVNDSGVRLISFGKIDIIKPNETIYLTYLLKVGVGVTNGKYENIAVAKKNNEDISNISKAEVMVVSDPLFDSTTIIGKVFHDRDEDGYQDDALAKNILIKQKLNSTNYVSKSTYLIYKTGKKVILKEDYPLDKGILIPNLPGKKFEEDNSGENIVEIYTQIRDENSVNNIELESKNGTKLMLTSENKIYESHIGDKLNGLTAENIKMSLEIKNIDGKLYQVIIVANQGIYEEGIPGVRLATVEGLVVITDQHGRYHIPEVNTDKGNNFIIKVDPVSIPTGAVFTTENPLVKRLGKNMMKFNFGIKFPERYLSEQKILKVTLRSTLFIQDSLNLKSKDTLKRILNNIEIGRYKKVYIKVIGMDKENIYELNLKRAIEIKKNISKEIKQGLIVEVLE